MENEQVAGNSLAENDEDVVISMVDFLKEEEELENDANAVFGDSDDKQCTYAAGVRPRQALYACKTCPTTDKAPAGICLACSYACHDGHELLELYTKRNFRCDCGNEKFPELTCKLCPDKAGFNCENVYNQNYKGLYCVCARPYPDPEDEVEDEMIQCVICEDWYHGRHLGKTEPPAHFHEMVCRGCMDRHDFLWAYTIQSQETSTLKDANSSGEVNVDTKGAKQEVPGDNSNTPTSAEEVKDDDKHGDKDGKCLYEDLKKREITRLDGATYWSEGFRSKLCVCDACKSMYKEQNVEFLPDENDTVMAYERRGLEQKTPSSHMDRERRVLETMDRVQQIEMVQGYNDMKSALSDYLKHFAENGKVVRAEDIQEFFSQMQARKRQKTDHTPAHFCR